jgi:hypothetical protein
MPAEFGAETVNAGSFLPWNAAGDDERHTALQQVYETAAAKGAMAFRPASLYWFGWKKAQEPRCSRAS